MLTFHVLTDFSAAAANALHYAALLARHVGGTVRIWHIRPEPGCCEAPVFSLLSQQWSVECMQELLADQVEKVSAWAPCTATLLTSEPTRHLSAAVGKGLGQIVVVGNSDPAKSMKNAETSTALHLVRQLVQPLLVVPVTYRAGKVPRRIVLDTDRRAVRLPAAAATIPGLLAQLTTSHQPLALGYLPGDVDTLLHHSIPSVVGLHVYTSSAAPEPGDVATRIQQTGLLEGVAHTVTSTRHSSVEEGIRHAATRHQADLLAFVTRQRMYAGTHFLRSVTAGLLAHSRIPVLTTPEQ
ncbi:universal stress protein [Hymenobacter endophyticus]|uniref:Universal stress protein n=1 Tax=Hymenobacter endophyticus TaxID=3076335 RepID=A0ABU3TJ78_9BACT|nr:universal stress protein [Hymenobacter endophyticus]MDU0371422.1 universal stress protein [Hymenobacter endophyticus]